MSKEEKFIDYTLVSEETHKKDLAIAKMKWRNEIFQKDGSTKKTYKYTVIAKFS